MSVAIEPTCPCHCFQMGVVGLVLGVHEGIRTGIRSPLTLSVLIVHLLLVRVLESLAVATMSAHEEGDTKGERKMLSYWLWMSVVALQILLQLRNALA